MSDELAEGALIALTHNEVDTLIHAIERAGVGISEEEFEKQYGSIYNKLNQFNPPGCDSDFRVR